MSDGDLIPNNQRIASGGALIGLGDMEDRVVLNISACPDLNPVNIATNRDQRPDRAISADGGSANHLCRGVNKDTFIKLWVPVSVGANIVHGLFHCQGVGELIVYRIFITKR